MTHRGYFLLQPGKKKSNRSATVKHSCQPTFEGINSYCINSTCIAVFFNVFRWTVHSKDQPQFVDLIDDRLFTCIINEFDLRGGKISIDDNI